MLPQRVGFNTHLQKDMYNITKIEGGFELEGRVYEFVEIDGIQYNLISESQVHILTDCGIILLDLNCTINENTYEDINAFINELYG